MPAMTHPATSPTRAAFFHALADHFDAHPELADVVVHRHENLQICSGWRDELPALLAWARSVGVDHVAVRQLGTTADPKIHVHLQADLAGHAVEVWDAVPALDRSNLVDGAIVGVDELLQIAADTAARVASDAVLAGAR